MLYILQKADVSVIHVIDEAMFYVTSGFEVQLGDGVNTETRKLSDLAKKYLGDKITYIEEFGVPKLKIDELLGNMEFDLLCPNDNLNEMDTHLFSKFFNNNVNFATYFEPFNENFADIDLLPQFELPFNDNFTNINISPNFKLLSDNLESISNNSYQYNLE